MKVKNSKKSGDFTTLILLAVIDDLLC